MKWLKFILSHSIFIAFCALAMVYQTNRMLQLHDDVFVYGFIFFATLSSYNFYWILSRFSFSGQTGLPRLVKGEFTGLLLFVISVMGALVCYLNTSIPLLYLITAVSLTIIYAIPLLPFNVLKFTRRAGVIKTLLLAFTWAYVTAFIPLLKSFLLLSQPDVFVISRRFLFMLILCIIFDNRDKAVDKMRGLHSLATDLHPTMLKWLAFSVLTVLFISNLFYGEYGISLSQAIALQVSTFALLLVYLLSAKKRSYFFYYFVVDGLMLFSALTTFIASI